MTDSNLARLIEHLGQPLSCLDIETTGGHLERDRITEIGIVTLHADGSTERWSTLVTPNAGFQAPSHA